ncbi:hypothetical protein FRC04_006686 [Tulasnella sp. 424]|nr:hypothetical protein FRC04_006686 [Tulasnella sp. 424]KAG8966725.1 hypothetical protein FRC05_002438 [Tulasnella sp. 425]
MLTAPQAYPEYPPVTPVTYVLTAPKIRGMMPVSAYEQINAVGRFLRQEWDQAAQKVARADREGGDVEALRGDFFRCWWDAAAVKPTPSLHFKRSAPSSVSLRAFLIGAENPSA